METTIKSYSSIASVNRLFIALSLLFILSLNSIQSVQAGTLNIIINGKAIHLSDAPAGTSFNENNYGAGFQYDYEEINGKWIPFIAASGFTDSFKNPSYNAGGGVMRRFKFSNNWHVDAGVYAFAMTRKDVKNNSPFLGALPVLNVGTDMVSVNMTYIPKVRPKFAEILFFQLKINTEIFN